MAKKSCPEIVSLTCLLQIKVTIIMKFCEVNTFFIVLIFNYFEKNVSSFVKFKNQEITVASWKVFSTRTNVESTIVCSIWCDTSDECTAFKYYHDTKICQLGIKGTVPTSSADLTMNVLERPGSFKILVVGGLSTSNSSAAEIINLDIVSASCLNYPTFPNNGFYGVAGMLDQQEKPLICGGCNTLLCSTFCYQLNGGSWTQSSSFSIAKMYLPIIKAPFKNVSRLFMIAGGFIASNASLVNTVEIQTTSGWEIFKPSLPSPISGHCMVSLPIFAALLIGGTNGVTALGDTFTMSNEKPVWTSGPSLKVARRYHGCSRIKNNSWNPKYSTIVVGGNNGNVFNSVEILDDESISWRFGPPLPISVYGLSMVEDQRGGVIVLGGYLTGAVPTDGLYRLRTSESANWELMKQKLANPRAFFTTIIMPDYKANCTYV